MSFRNLFYILPFIVSSILFADCDNGAGVCLSLEGSDLNYTSDTDIAGFQFGHDGCVTAASGGDATAAGFMISSSGSAVIGFSLTGAVVPAGSGTLLALDGDVSLNCLSDFIFSDSAGQAIEVDFYVEPIPGCTDMNACNYDSSANTDDGSCLYDDCNGECGGDAQEDECGVCEGDGTSCDYGCEEGTDVCLTLDGGNLNYDTTTDVAGFQFNHNGCVTAASGGDAEAAGFMISSSGTAVLGFSLTGAVIPAGSGTLLVLDGDVAVDCLSNFIFSDSDGQALVVNFPVVLVDGCTDMSACNYDPEANNDDGSCEYPEDNYDCDGNCTVDTDCTGECGGDAEVDDCGICEGDGSQCTASLSLSIDDQTGHMLVHMANAMDVAGFQFNVSNVSINGVSGGSAEANGFMVSGANGNVVGFSLTGNVIPPGDEVLVEIDFAALWNEACLNSVVLSDALGNAIDWTAGDCITLDYTVIDGCMDSDACNFNPEANVDDGSCEYAEENYDCDGNCIVDIDCAGECGGTAELDQCGICDGDNSTCSGCTDPYALNYDSEAIVDDGSCQYPADVTIWVENVSSDGEISVYMENIYALAGFQFEIESSCEVFVNSGSGGTAGDAGFMVSASGTTVLGFSLSGAVIDAGAGTLVNLDASFDCETGTFGLADVILSDINGESMTFNLGPDFNYESSCSDEEACNYGEEGACWYPNECEDCDGNNTCWENDYYMVEVNQTGASHLVVFLDSIEGLEVGDEIGLFDLNGVTETAEAGESANYGEVLVGAGVWDGVANEQGTVTEVVGIMSEDLSDFGGPILNGAVSGNDIVIRIYRPSIDVELQVETTYQTGGAYGDIFSVVSGMSFEELPDIGEGCDYDGDGSNDDGFVVDCSYSCVSDAFLGDNFCDDTFPNFACEEFQWDGNECCDESEQDCEGNCFGDAVEDCAGECNGSAEFDDCGICEGDGLSCEVYVELELTTTVDESVLDDMDAFEDDFCGLIESELGLPDETCDVTGVTITSDSRDEVEITVDFTITLTEEELADTSFESEEELSGAWEEVEDEIDEGLPEFVYGCTDDTACNFNEAANVSDGSCEYAEVGLDCDGNELSNDSSLPTVFSLFQNYPNPFNPETVIEFYVPNLSEVSLIIYDLSGKPINVVANGTFSPGMHSVTWDGMSFNREAVSSGVYLYKLITPDGIIVRQLTLIR